MDRLTSPKVMEALLRKYGFTMNKRFGQNFLTDENIVRKIVEAAQIKDTDVVLEIGPGIGTMTRALCEQAKTVLAVEIDDKLIPILKETLRDKENCRLIHADILKVDIREELQKIGAASFKVVANLPYYITTPIVMGLLEQDLPLESITVMIQKEVAQRITATPGGKDYGALTVACGYYTESQLAFFVPASVFYPKPKVDSAVIHMKVLGGERMDPKEKKAFFTVVKAAFGNRRKTLLNSLTNNLSLEKEGIKALLAQANIEEGRRAETLAFEEFHRLALTYRDIIAPHS
jgi:16S rRNA (adenine1518-N6/adenine1519-N6)-dimethyltransferase